MRLVVIVSIVSTITNNRILTSTLFNFILKLHMFVLWIYSQSAVFNDCKFLQELCNICHFLSLSVLSNHHIHTKHNAFGYLYICAFG